MQSYHFVVSIHAHKIIPSVFLKASTCIASASEPIILPSNVDYDEADYEVELAIVIGKQCKTISVSEAANYVLGYSVANDVTARKHQDKTSQWSYAKGMVCRQNASPVILIHVTDLQLGWILPTGSLHCIFRAHSRRCSLEFEDVPEWKDHAEWIS